MDTVYKIVSEIQNTFFFLETHIITDTFVLTLVYHLFMMSLI